LAVAEEPPAVAGKVSEGKGSVVALKILTNGQYVVKTKAQAIEALQMMETIKEEVAAIRKRHGMDDLEQDAVELKKAVTRYCTSNGVDRLDFTHDKSHYHGTLIAGYDKKWLLTTDDLRSAGQPTGAKALRSILKRKFLNADEFKRVWSRATKRVADPEGIDALVSEGILSERDIAPALAEKPRTPYLRIFED
jgi:hypothetical protein